MALDSVTPILPCSIRSVVSVWASCLAALSAIAYTVWSVLLKYNPVSRIAPFMFLQPIFGVTLSLLLYGGEMGDLPRYAAALALVCLSIVIVGKGQCRG